VNDWLEKARRDLAGAVGDYAAAYELTGEDVRVLLDLARVAAHESGDRPTAPLACYLVGLARGRHPDRSLDDLVVAVAGPPPDSGGTGAAE
jgi:hypothetical protein